MPRIPKWIGDTMETLFSGMIHPVTVSSVEYLSPGLMKIIFTGDFTRIKFAAGNVIEFRLNHNDFRHYTISHYDKEKGICEMLLYLHGNGIGSQWAHSLKTGDHLKVMGPGGKLKYDDKQSAHFIFGDETSIGLFACMQEEAQKNGHGCYCLAELEPGHYGWPELAEVRAEVVSKSLSTPAKEATEKIAAYRYPFWLQWRYAAFYITGRAKSIQAVRKALLTQGVSMKNIKTEPYWAEGKKGL